MVRITEEVTRRIQKVLQEAGISGDEHILIEQFKLSDMPQDAYLTEVALIRAEHEGKKMGCKYYCYVCGKKHEEPDDLIKCIEEHIKQFMSGVPIPTTKEHLEYKKETIRNPLNIKDFIKKE